MLFSDLCSYLYRKTEINNSLVQKYKYRLIFSFVIYPEITFIQLLEVNKYKFKLS